MPVLTISAGTAFAATQRLQGARALEPPSHDAGVIDIGLVNNMPDAALAATERQFLKLLDCAAGERHVRVRLFFLPGVARSEHTREQMVAAYCPMDELFNARLDALIVTGTEPRASSLSNEPYWESLVRLIEWARESTLSGMWSCLAAHAAVLHLDGIPRHMLSEKLTGMFECASVPSYPLTAGLAARTRVAHSRWNELREDALVHCNYRILTRSAQAGVDAFVKDGQSLFLFFQGHPEYDRATLLREYRRDVARFLRGERDTYPGIPQGYMDRVAADTLARFQEQAVLQRRASLLDAFPFSFVESRLLPHDRRSMVRLYANWLSYLCLRKEQMRNLPRDRARLRARPASVAQSAQGIG